MNVNPTVVAKKASPLCGGKVCYPTQLAAAIALFKIQNKREPFGQEPREQRAYRHGTHWHLTSRKQ